MSDRRDFLKTAGAAFTTSIFTGRVRGANDRIRVGFIGVGRQGKGNMHNAMAQPEVDVVAVCDCYEPNLDEAVALSAKGLKTDTAARSKAKAVKDFREVLQDKSIDAVCIATPDHWHAYIAVEACKAGKDVYVEKPICVVVEEGRKMVEAARKYNRVVQVGTQQRSGIHFQKAVDIVKSGKLGKITFCRTWNYSNGKRSGFGNPPDSDPPQGLDWDRWLGPAPQRPFNANRFGVAPDRWSTFRYFWDYAGGMMTDWGIHLLDIVQMAFNESTPVNVTALGGRFWVQDNTETPDTLQVTYEYPEGFLCTYEWRQFNANSMFDKGYGILFHGTKGTMFVDRSLYQVIPEKGSDLEPMEEKSSNNHGRAHWANFVECIRTRQKPISDIEIGHRSTSTALLGNVALRSNLRVDWDSAAETTPEHDARKFLHRSYRKPWKLDV